MYMTWSGSTYLLGFSVNFFFQPIYENSKIEIKQNLKGYEQYV
jgi:hypothetical protein